MNTIPHPEQVKPAKRTPPALGPTIDDVIAAYNVCLDYLTAKGGGDIRAKHEAGKVTHLKTVLEWQQQRARLEGVALTKIIQLGDPR